MKKRVKSKGMLNDFNCHIIDSKVPAKWFSEEDVSNRLDLDFITDIFHFRYDVI